MHEGEEDLLKLTSPGFRYNLLWRLGRRRLGFDVVLADKSELQRVCSFATAVLLGRK
jgi:hypothetical protein